jgi:hypothetical protein
LLQDVIERTEAEQRRSAPQQSDDDRLHPYAGRGPVDLDGGGGFDDE